MKMVMTTLLVLLGSNMAQAANCSFGVYDKSGKVITEAELKGITGEHTSGDFTISVTERAGAMMMIEVKDNKKDLNVAAINHQGPTAALDVSLITSSYTAVAACTPN